MSFEKSEELLTQAEKHDAWAATRVKNYNSIEGAYPIYASYAKGAYIWDVDGNKYIDYTLGYGTIILGHANSKVNQAVASEIQKGTCFSPLWSSLQVDLTNLLTSIIPGAEMAFLMKTGSDATSGAVRLARIYTKRDKVIRWGYNGWHDWATPRPKGVPLSVQANTLHFHYNELDSLEKIFLQYPDQIACVIMMPFELEKPYPNFLQDVKDIAHKYGAIFILDEMRSGFRLKLGGAQEYFNIKADLATYSKAISNGYPISAIVGRADILKGIGETKMTATFFANPPEMAAALATISILKDSNAISYIWKLGDLFLDGIKKLIDKYEIPAHVIGYSPVPFIKFSISEPEKLEQIKAIFYSATAKLGVLLHPNHHWYISASHTVEDIKHTLYVFEEGFKMVSNELKIR